MGFLEFEYLGGFGVKTMERWLGFDSLGGFYV